LNANANRAPPYRVDPGTGASTPISVPFISAGVAVGENAVWIVGTNGVVARIDPATNHVVKLIGTENGATQVAAGLDAVWILNPRRYAPTAIRPP
jgi:hypothetical protein